MFFEKLENRVKGADSLLCIGLDPHISQLSEPPTAQAALDFCLRIIEESHPYAAAFKPNIAFFEYFGEHGMQVLNQVISAIPNDIPIILDCKRGDIDTTAQAYAAACYEAHKSSAVTLSPYMGWDSIKPFVTGKYADKGAFVLCKTSNNSSKDLQDQKLLNGNTIYSQVATLCSEWNSKCENECIGLVVGATDLPALKSIREKVPTSWILCPGVGAQGGDAQSVCNVGLRKDGSGILVSVSRGISSASDISIAARLLRDEINECRKNYLTETISIISTDIKEFQKSFIEFSISKNVLKFGSFKLKSGRISPYFFNAGLFDDGMSMSKLGTYYAQAIHDSGIEFDVIFGPAYKGIPLATAISISWYNLYNENKDVTYNRKEAKDHGEGGLLVGAKIAGRRVLVVDDVITAGTAIRESADIITQFDGKIVAVAISLDRQEKVSEDESESAIQQVSRSLNVSVISIVKLKNLISYIQNLSDSSTNGLASHLPTVMEYRSRYGVDY